MRTRSDRTNDFDDFYDKSIEVFKKLRDEDSNADKFEKEYTLSVCPGSRAGGQDKRIIEVFWGSRPYEFTTHPRGWSSLIESGATLSLYRLDSGYVTISLYPASTDNRRFFEDSITIHHWLDPKKLKDNKLIKSLWGDFMAYMECTSLDGTPSRTQRNRIWYLRNFKNLVVDKTWRPTKFSKFSRDVLKYVLTVGLSGFIFFIVSTLSEPKESETNLYLKNLNEQTKLQTDQLQEMLTEQSQMLKEISNLHQLNTKLLNFNDSQKDSVNNKIKEIIENISLINAKIERLNAERTTSAKNP